MKPRSLRTVRILASLCLLLSATGLPQQAQAQFYYNGRGPMGLRWRQIKSPNYKLVYPDYYAPTAAAMAGFLDTIAPTIGHGFTRPPQRIPIVLHTENLNSNGEVVWAPKRMELMTTAPAGGGIYADPWLKQLAVHESRHVVQLSALRSGVTKVASWLLGQAGTSVGMLVVPKWFLEGDATLAETQYSEFGRAYQPAFTVGMRALLAADSANIRLRSDRWIAGSYRQYIPGLYEYGYQLVAAGERYHGAEMWSRAVEYAGRWPIFIVPMRIYLKRHYGTHLGDLSVRALGDLYEHWKPYSAVEESYRTLTAPARRRSGFTTYGDPIATPIGVVATKTDYDTPPRFVAIDTTTHTERTIRWIAPPSSRPTFEARDGGGGTLWWTEFKPHPVWEYKNYSVVRSLDLATGKRHTYGRWEANYFATPLTVSSDDGGARRRFVATVSPDSTGGSDLVLHEAESFREVDRLRLDRLTTVHGVAWDDSTQTLAFIALGERGMHLRRVGVSAGGGFTTVEEITEPSMVTLSGLRADGCGRLYFGSIESGKDEIHTIDLTEAGYPERRITTSRFGAYAPAGDTMRGEVLFTTYTAEGYQIARTARQDTQDTVVRRRLPADVLNIPAPSWGVPTMNALPMADTAALSRIQQYGENLHWIRGPVKDSTPYYEIKKYNKALRWFNIHSWAPLTADMDDLLNANERELALGFGASLFFQSVLGDSYGSATFGRMRGDNWLQGSWTYAGLPVQITAEVEYGGGKQGVYIPVGAYDEGLQALQALGERKNYLRASAVLSAPLSFSGGSRFRLLQPSLAVTHYNSLLYDPDRGRFTKGYRMYQASLWWSENRRASVRCVVPRLGYAVRAAVLGSFNDRFGMLYSFYARGYLPGLLPNHSMTLRAAGMYQTAAELGFGSKPLAPRGAYSGRAAEYYGAAAYDYTFPVCYPDGGINGLIYFKRIWLNLFGDFSRGAYFASGGKRQPENIWSYGADIAFELNVAGSSTPTTVKFTLAAPSNEKFYFGVGLALDF